MIVIVGSRYDPVAAELVSQWPNAALCSAEDLVSPGWAWYMGAERANTWVVNGESIPDGQITGVFLRRSGVYAEELTSIHPDDRSYVAAEAQALLTFVLATTTAQVINPVVDGAFGEESFRPERWFTAASELGLTISPSRATTEPRRSPRRDWREAEIAGNRVFGKGLGKMGVRIHALAQRLDLKWGVIVFDSRKRLIGITVARRPSRAAIAELANLLVQKRP